MFAFFECPTLQQLPSTFYCGTGILVELNIALFLPGLILKKKLGVTTGVQEGNEQPQTTKMRWQSL
jgi:hypothetical protein